MVVLKLKQCGTAVFTGAPEDRVQVKLIVGVVAVVIIAGAIVGLICWLYMKNSRYGNN